MRVYCLVKFKHIIVLFLALLMWRCAQVAPLTGGQRDSQAPKLLNAIPQNISLNFKAKFIELTFDEYIQVKDIANQLVITPQLKNQPEVEAKGKKVIINLSYTELLPNTTYRFFFGNSIQDMHEGNTLSNFEYVFSTGDKIDSLIIEGKVNNAFNLKAESDITVGLYNSSESDSVVWKQNPLYFTKTNANGIFSINYLPTGDFKAFAFSDKNKNLKYDGGEEMIGFLNNTINTNVDSNLIFTLFKEKPIKFFVKKAFSLYYGMAKVIYNAEQDNNVKAFQESQDKLLCTEGGTNDTCLVYYHDIFDTLKLVVKHANKSLIDTISINLLSKEKLERLKQERKLLLDIELKPLVNGVMPYYETAALKFNAAMDFTSIDMTKVSLTRKQDTILTKLSPQFKAEGCDRLLLLEKLSEDAVYDLVIKSGAIKTKFGLPNDSVKISFRTSLPDDYASLQLKLLFPDKSDYIIQLMNDKQEIARELYCEQSISSSAEQTFSFKNLLPGNYYVKLIRDENKNKMWDTGHLLQKTQPETVYLNAIPIKLLANWDSESEWKVK